MRGVYSREAGTLVPSCDGSSVPGRVAGVEEEASAEAEALPPASPPLASVEEIESDTRDCGLSEAEFDPGGAIGEGARSRYDWKRRCGNVVPKKAPARGQEV